MELGLIRVSVLPVGIPQYLVEEVADVVVTQPLGFQKFVQVRLHQGLHDVHILQSLNSWRPQDVSNVNYVFMLKSVENFDFSERSLAVCLVLKGRDFLDGNLSVT